MAVKDVVIHMDQEGQPTIRASVGPAGTVVLEQDGNRIALDTSPASVREFFNGVTVAVTAAKQVQGQITPLERLSRPRPVEQRGQGSKATKRR